MPGLNLIYLSYFAELTMTPVLILNHGLKVKDSCGFESLISGFESWVGSSATSPFHQI